MICFTSRTTTAGGAGAFDAGRLEIARSLVRPSPSAPGHPEVSYCTVLILEQLFGQRKPAAIALRHRPMSCCSAAGAACVPQYRPPSALVSGGRKGPVDCACVQVSRSCHPIWPYIHTPKAAM